MNFPSELKYSKDHEWIRVEGNTGYIGITDFAQKELGDIVYMDIPSVGQTLKLTDIFGTVEAVKTVSDLFMPVSAVITEFNAELEANPELVNSDPYTKGWIVKVTLTDASELEKLLSVEEYKTLIGA